MKLEARSRETDEAVRKASELELRMRSGAGPGPELARLREQLQHAESTRSDELEHKLAVESEKVLEVQSELHTRERRMDEMRANHLEELARGRQNLEALQAQLLEAQRERDLARAEARESGLPDIERRGSRGSAGSVAKASVVSSRRASREDMGQVQVARVAPDELSVAESHPDAASFDLPEPGDSIDFAPPASSSEPGDSTDFAPPGDSTDLGLADFAMEPASPTSAVDI